MSSDTVQLVMLNLDKKLQRNLCCMITDPEDDKCLHLIRLVVLVLCPYGWDENVGQPSDRGKFSREVAAGERPRDQPGGEVVAVMEASGLKSSKLKK